ncbi:hypothetical protein QTP88_020125 [Uroleucon formosanum]
MSQYMLYGGFNPVEPTLNGLNDLDDTSPIGRIYEVDVTYPQHLHNDQNDLSYLPQNSIPSGSKVRKLMATFEEKKNYIVHYQNLQQEIKNGLKVEKVHRVIQFNQSNWLAKYIDLNTQMRKKARNAFEKDFFKLMNNAVFGFAVLDISKTLMYDYHYNVMKAHYGNRIKLMYTDTDSLVYHISTENFYEDLAANANLLNRMDTVNLPSDHPCYVRDRKKHPGYFSDEVDGNMITEFCALRAKSYAFNIYAGPEENKDHRKCLFGEDGVELYRDNVSIRSFNHQLMTISTKKLTYNSYDDKRVVLDDKIHTIAHGHYSIEEDDWFELDGEEQNWNEKEKGLMRGLLHCITCI